MKECVSQMFIVFKEAVERDGLCIRHADDCLKHNESLVMAAVQQNGYSLDNMPEEIQSNYKICLAALTSLQRDLDQNRPNYEYYDSPHQVSRNENNPEGRLQGIKHICSKQPNL